MSISIQQQLNQWGFEKHPFVFLIDFECLKPMCWSLKEPIINFEYDFNGFTNIVKRNNLKKEFDKTVQFIKHPISLDSYQKKFNYVKTEIELGNSFLVNLTSSIDK